MTSLSVGNDRTILQSDTEKRCLFEERLKIRNIFQISIGRPTGRGRGKGRNSTGRKLKFQ